LYVDRDDCEVFNYAIQAIEKLEKIEQLLDKANKVYDDVNWWLAVWDIEKIVKGEIVTVEPVKPLSGKSVPIEKIDIMLEEINKIGGITGWLDVQTEVITNIIKHYCKGDFE
jgi:hypothetical protein